MFKFSESSAEKLLTAHPDLQKIMNKSISISPMDFGIAEAHRPVSRQKALFDKGASKIDGINRKGKHNYDPSLAVDIYAFINSKPSWNMNNYIHLAGVIQAVAKMMYEKGDVKHLIRWGGNWDKDGEILTDQKFDDGVHFEIYVPKNS
jgi:peptidoglycan L-alanyl-D-glutamate endopeptidase CwlK